MESWIGRVFRNRVNGFKESLKSRKLEPKFVLEINNECELKPTLNSLELIKDILIDSKISAIFCITDLVAVALLELLRKNNIRVPEDISVIGFDNHMISETCYPGLTTINNDLKTLGEIAVDNLISKIEKQKFLKNRHIIEPYLVKRESVAKI